MTGKKVPDLMGNNKERLSFEEESSFQSNTIAYQGKNPP